MPRLRGEFFWPPLFVSLLLWLCFAGCSSPIDAEAVNAPRSDDDGGAEREADSGVESAPRLDAGADHGLDAGAAVEPSPSGNPELAVGCLDEGCDLSERASRALAACVATVEGLGGTGAEAQVVWSETGGITTEPYGRLTLKCISAELSEVACAPHCEANGFSDAQFVAEDDECSCQHEVSGGGDLLGSLSAIVCSPATADVGLSVRRGDMPQDAMTVTCRAGAETTGACDDALEVVNDELSVSFGTAAAFAAGCSFTP